MVGASMDVVSLDVSQKTARLSRGETSDISERSYLVHAQFTWRPVFKYLDQSI